MRVFEWDAPTAAWIQRGNDIDGEAAGDWSGYSVALSGDGSVLVVGATVNKGTGKDVGYVRVFEWDAPTGAWIQRGNDIDGEAAGDYSGYSVALSDDGTVLAVGACGNDSAGKFVGHMRVFEWGAPTAAWTQRGNNIDGEAARDWSGYSVALSGDGSVLAVGAPENDSASTNEGHVRVLEWDAPTAAWTERGNDINGEATEDLSGESVALSYDGTVLAVGASFNNGAGSSAGHVRVFKWEALAAAWTQRGNDIDGEAAGDYFGYSVALSDDGTVLAVGAPLNGRAGVKSGHVRAFEWDASTAAWIPRGNNIYGEAAGDWSGRLVALSGDGTVLVVGADENDGDGEDAGHVRVYKWDSATVS